MKYREQFGENYVRKRIKHNGKQLTHKKKNGKKI